MASKTKISTLATRTLMYARYSDATAGTTSDDESPADKKRNLAYVEASIRSCKAQEAFYLGLGRLTIRWIDDSWYLCDGEDGES